MLLIDEQEWPLVLARWEAPVSEMDLGFYRDCLRAWTRRPQRFAVLGFQPPAMEGGSTHGTGWPAELRAQLRKRCAGLALVRADGRFDERLAEQDAQRMQASLGCAVRVFADGDAALRWLREALRAPEPAVAPTTKAARGSRQMPPPPPRA